MNPWFKRVVMMWGAIASLFHIYIAVIGYYDPFVVIPTHVFLIGILGFLVLDWKGRQRTRFDRSFLIDLPLIIILIVAVYNPVHNPDQFLEKYYALDTTTGDKLLGLSLILLSLELTRRAVGKTLLLFAVIFLIYDMYGRYLPGELRHQGFSLLKIAEEQYFSDHGMWSIVRIIATYVMLFIIFGSFIDRAKGGVLIQRFGNWIFGASPGGPAKVAVVTSSMFGTISGSAVANVVTTGSFTIPMMKRIGFPPHVAGAVEAAASTGGQIMPPIMGAVAFVMADVLGISYFKVCVAAAIPAILYYWALFSIIDFDARARRMKGIPREELPRLREVLPLVHLVIPIVLLLGTLMAGYSVMMAGLAGIFSTIILSTVRQETRMNFATLFDGLYAAARTTVVVSATCLTAGIIVGVVHQTGLGLRLSGQILTLTHGYPFFGLLLIMGISLMLGMGMPTVPAYVITVAVGATVLAKLGFVPIASHMFILYFAVISCITPPVMVACYAASALAEANVWKIGIHAVKLAFITYLIPFIFIYNPTLLVVAVPTTFAQVLFMFISAAFGTLAATAGLAGYFFQRIPFVVRIGMVISGFLLIQPGVKTDLIGLAIFALLSLTNKAFRNLLYQKFFSKGVVE
jgi:TRAP transporter 4TM/12TM fusion protein